GRGGRRGGLPAAAVAVRAAPRWPPAVGRRGRPAGRPGEAHADVRRRSGGRRQPGRLAVPGAGDRLHGGGRGGGGAGAAAARRLTRTITSRSRRGDPRTRGRPPGSGTAAAPGTLCVV